jgi:long-chain acyl-CoA synthetase
LIDPDRFINLGGCLRASAERNPRKTAFVVGRAGISFEHLDQRTSSLAAWMLHQGYKPGDRVVIHWPNSLETVELLFACFKAGMIAVPLNVRMRMPDVAYVVRHSSAVAYFAHPELSGIANDASTGCVGLRVFHALPAFTDAETGTAMPDIDTDAAAMLLYTLRTTAPPKAVTHSHRTLLESVRLVRDMAAHSLQCSLVMTQLGFISAMYFGLLATVVTGGTSILASRFDASSALDLMERFQCTCAFGLPSMLALLMNEQQRTPRDVRSLRTFVAEGGSVPGAAQEHFRALFGARFVPVFRDSHFGGEARGVDGYRRDPAANDDAPELREVV